MRAFQLVSALALLVLLGVVVMATSCVDNDAFHVRTWSGKVPTEVVSCESAFRELREEGFDLGFVEFTERGNVFRRDCMDYVVSKVKERANEGDTAVVVFVHGWRHNAEAEAPERDQNVHCFKQLLAGFVREPGAGDIHDELDELCVDEEFPELDGAALAADLPPSQVRGVLSGKKVVGIYVGWRGLPFRGGPLELATYWDRKPVAEEVGRGGVTELLLRLEDHVWRPGTAPRESTPTQYAPVDQNDLAGRKGNVFLVIGHSFGGAIVLSALNNVFIDRVVSAQPTSCWAGAPDDAPKECVVTRPFGHGVVLLNPAIEANQLLPLKELTIARRFSSEQGRLFHVVSTSADDATHWAFPRGQWLGTLSWEQAELWRNQASSWVSFDEQELDMTTVGNFSGFRTGFLDASGESTEERPRWCYRSCVPSVFGTGSTVTHHDCVEKDEAANRYETQPFEPLAFIYTDESFMRGHNDVFNPRVRAYLSAIVAESMRRRGELPSFLDPSCHSEGGFGDCFSYFLSYEARRLAAAGLDPASLGGYSSDEVCEREREQRWPDPEDWKPVRSGLAANATSGRSVP